MAAATSTSFIYMSTGQDFSTMSSRVLLIGEDPILVQTRALILAEWHPTSAKSEEALEKLHAGSFDVVIIGQLVPVGMAFEIVRAARALDPAPDILAIRYPDDETDLGVETHPTDGGSKPGWLRGRVAVLMERRSPR